MPNSDNAVQLRPAVPSDAPEVGRIWRTGWHDGHDGFVPDELVAARTPESFATRAGERASDTWVATVDDQVAGFVMVVGDEVEQVYVDRVHRGSGIADQLLAKAAELIAADGHTQAWLAVVAGNGRARRFYERNGWTDDGPFDYAASHGEDTISVPCRRYVRPV